MSDDEVDDLVKEAEKNRENDKKKKESIEIRNLADSTIYQSEKTINENKDKFDEKLKKEAEEKIADLKKVLENPDATKEEIEPVTKELNDIMMKI